ncbi:MAG: choice-of-anchor L domain-containing protein, partial [Actinomycetota bacterium]
MFVRTGVRRSLPAPAARFAHPLETLERRTLFAVSVTPYDTADPTSILTDALLVPGTGINLTGVNFVGVDNQAGTYSNFAETSGQTLLAIPDGILLTSGSVDDVVGFNASPGTSTSTGGPGDADLDLLTDDTTADANALTLTFTTDAGVQSVILDFVFGSEEFYEFVGDFNDAFAVYLDGMQISFDIFGNPITVNNDFFTLNNSGVFVPETTQVEFELDYDGFTPHIRTQAPLDTSLTTHTLKLVIADAGDSALDSGVFISSLQGSTVSVSGPTTDLPTPGAVSLDAAEHSAAENAGTVEFTVTRTSGTSGLVTVDYAVTPSGTATDGLDFLSIFGTLTFVDGQETATISVDILDDFLLEGDETFTITLSNPTGSASLGTFST